MKITSIGLYSNNFEVANFNFRDPESLNPYVIQGISGVDADEIVPKFYGFSSASKTKQYELAPAKREIVLLIALVPKVGSNKSHSDLRDDLYRAVASSRSGLVQLRFNNGSAVVAGISGFITKVESSLSTKTPQVQLTIKCSETFFRSIEPRYLDQFSLGTSFTIADTLSTAPHGMTFSLKFLSDTASFTIRDSSTPEWFFTVTPGSIFGGSGFKNGHILTVSSEDDDKQLSVTDGTEVLYLVNKVAIGSTWPRLFPGNNDFEVVTGSFEWVSMSYWTTYWGL